MLPLHRHKSSVFLIPDRFLPTNNPKNPAFALRNDLPRNTTAPTVRFASASQIGTNLHAPLLSIAISGTIETPIPAPTRLNKLVNCPLSNTTCGFNLARSHAATDVSRKQCPSRKSKNGSFRKSRSAIVRLRASACFRGSAANNGSVKIGVASKLVSTHRQHQHHALRWQRWPHSQLRTQQLRRPDARQALPRSPNSGHQYRSPSRSPLRRRLLLAARQSFPSNARGREATPHRQHRRQPRRWCATSHSELQVQQFYKADPAYG
jgi:hypothetical protein